MISDEPLSAEEKIMLAQAARERADIVEKYDKVCPHIFMNLLFSYFIILLNIVKEQCCFVVLFKKKSSDKAPTPS